MNDLPRLRAHAINSSLFPPTTLKAALDRLSFVQADPIRSPARAQDLILRHRVIDYKAGDLERQYPSLDIEEDILYAYGFLPRAVWRLLHPRKKVRLTKLENEVLAAVKQAGAVHPGELEKSFGRNRVLNAWGSHSKATTSALDNLQYRGFLRVCRRDNGIRVYAAARPIAETLTPMERLQELLLVMAGILAPALKTTLQAYAARFGRSRGIKDPGKALENLVRAGRLEKTTVDGLTYLWPPRKAVPEEAPRRVRFLAPFDPVVWDRRRFEHFWGWPYRFEAYTPPAKRLRGYYAMPLLWGDEVIGWANASAASGRPVLEFGFVEKRPTDGDFNIELEAETARLETFLDLRASSRDRKKVPPRAASRLKM